MGVRIRIVIEYDWDASDDTTIISQADLDREIQDWISGGVSVADLFGAAANPKITATQA